MSELTFDILCEIHDGVIEESGGEQGILDENLLIASIMNIYQKVFKTELYPSIEEKAARICYSLATTQGFVDGNKRTAIAAMNYILEDNDYYLDCSDDELIALGYGVANNEIPYEDILKWVRGH